MKNLILITLLALVAACSQFSDPSLAEGTIVGPGNFRAGSGTIQSVAVLRNANKAPGAQDPNLYRIALQMDVGGYQTVDTDNAFFMQGQAVELTNDGRVVLVSGTTLNRALGKN
jgi:hypothetical protein